MSKELDYDEALKYIGADFRGVDTRCSDFKDTRFEGADVEGIAVTIKKEYDEGLKMILDQRKFNGYRTCKNLIKGEK